MTQNNQYIIAIDIGTPSTKAVLFTTTGKPVYKHDVEYPLYKPTPDAAEQNPSEIFNAVIASVREVVVKSKIDPTDLLCLSFSAAMHSLIAVDREGRLLSQSLTWADNRSAKWAEKLKRSQLGPEIYLRTGTPIHAMSPLVKLVWMRNEYPDFFDITAKFISIKEYVFYHLFQEYIIDYSLASATGLLNLKLRTWDREALEIAGITPGQLSELVPTTHVLESMKENQARAMGIPANIPTVIGASDGVLSNLGVGAIAPRTLAINIGTSGAVRAVVDRPKTDPKGRIFCYNLTEKHWVIGGAVNNGGIVLRWVRDRLCDAEVATAKQLGADPYDLLTAIAQTAPPGSAGLIFHPYLTGERSPLWDASARGSFFGLSLEHGKAHIIRAVLEGIGFNLQQLLQAVEELTGTAEKIKATGGFVKSEFVLQLLADIFDREIIVPETYESACLGAAVLGLYALKEIPSLNAVSEMLGEAIRHRPHAANVEIYQQMIPLYDRILSKIKGEYQSIWQLQNG